MAPRKSMRTFATIACVPSCSDLPAVMCRMLSYSSANAYIAMHSSWETAGSMAERQSAYQLVIRSIYGFSDQQLRNRRHCGREARAAGNYAAIRFADI
jgi:hypothetical protein